MKTITLQRAAAGIYGDINVQITADIRNSVSNLANSLGNGNITCLYEFKGEGVDDAIRLGVPFNIDKAGSVADILNVTEADGNFTVTFSDGDTSATFTGY